MEKPIEERLYYRPAKRVDWGTFLGWAAGTFLLALLLALGMAWLFSKGWYLILLVPVFTSLFVASYVSITVNKGKCRFPALGAAFGFLIGMVLYGGYFYFCMVSFLGIQNAGRIDLLPRYISLRLHTDVHHNAGRPGEGIARPDPVINGGIYGFECIFVLFVTTMAGYRRAGRSFCEKCGEWKRQDIAIFPPGNGATIRQWLDEGELGKLAVTPQYIPTSKSSKGCTLIAIERCDWAGGEECPVYFAVKDAATARGKNTVFDESLGRLRSRRVELTAVELEALRPVFPQLDGAKPISPIVAGLSQQTGGGTLIEVTPIPATESGKVLTRGAIAAGNLMGISILFVFFGSIAGALFGWYYSQVSQVFNRGAFDPVRLTEGLGLAGVSVVLLIFSGQIGQKNSGAPGNLYFRYRARKAIAHRRNKLVDPDRPSDLPTYFVQMVPRKNWGRVMLETAEDTGFLQIDPRRGELRFEGDVERYRIPAAAITSCELANYSSSANTTKLEYWVIVIQGKTARGMWEAPISLRQTKWLVPADHRKRSAEEIRNQIIEMMPQGSEAGATIEQQGGELVQSVAQVPLRERKSVSLSVAFRLVVVIVAVLVGIWRGVANRRSHAESGNAGNSEIPLATEAVNSGHQLIMRLTNVRPGQKLIDTPPFYADGGNWTVCDCEAAANPEARFTVALEKPRQAIGELPITFGHAEILPGDRDAGGRFINELTRAMGVSVPALLTPQPLQPLNIGTAVLGEHLGSPQEGLKEGMGSWVATKWFIQNEGLDAEVYFNYDLEAGDAVFSEKDSEYNADVLAGLAAAMRDGPRPVKTAQNDPNFTDECPKIMNLRAIPNSERCSIAFARGGKLLILYGHTSPSVVEAVSLDDPAQRIALGQFDGFVSRVICGDADANTILVEERIGKDAFTLGPNDSVRFWWLDRSAHVRRELKGSWGQVVSLSGGEKALSPDSRYMAVQRLSGTVLDRQRSIEMQLVDVRDGTIVKATVNNCILKGWRGEGADLRAIVEQDNVSKTGIARKLWLVDPVTGNASVAEIGAETLSNPMVSPDHHMKLVLHPKESVEVIDLARGTSRVFTFDPDDRRFAELDNFTWLSPRYVRFYTSHECFIDVVTMKMGYMPVVNQDGESESILFSEDFKWAAAFQKSGVSLGRVGVPDALMKSSDPMVK